MNRTLHAAALICSLCLPGLSSHAQSVPVAAPAASTAQPAKLSDLAVDAPAAAPRADADVCARVATERGLGKVPFESWVLFNTAGAVCYAPFPLRQKDILRYGVVVARGESMPVAESLNVTACTVPSSTPSVLGPSSLQAFTPTAGPTVGVKTLDRDQLVVLRNVDSCASDSPVLAATVAMPSSTAATQSTTLTLFPRYAATLHIGVIGSKLRDPAYGLVTTGGQTVITDKEARSRGPEYVAMLVVQAAPRYLSFGGPVYPGRDMLHDNAPIDRIGLAFSFGLKDPTKRFGLGLAYEIASGINLVAVHEWAKRSTLDGVKVGDAFTGAAADIPTRSEWSKGWALGLSFDTAYLTAIFTKK